MSNSEWGKMPHKGGDLNELFTNVRNASLATNSTMTLTMVMGLFMAFLLNWIGVLVCAAFWFLCPLLHTKGVFLYADWFAAKYKFDRKEVDKVVLDAIRSIQRR